MRRLLWPTVAVVLLLSTVGPWAPGGAALADPHELRARPFAFVGRAGDCGDDYPAGARIVTSAWLGGMGLPDDGGPNVGPNPANNPSKNDPHRGLLLSKNGTTADCSAAGATITRVQGMTVTPTFALGFDYRNGGHCGAGAPRFNVNTDMGFFFVGCASGSPDRRSAGSRAVETDTIRPDHLRRGVLPGPCSCRRRDQEHPNHL